jgi:hypothetical protein
MIDDLKKIIKGDVESTDEVLEKYSHDASIFKVRPEVVEFKQELFLLVEFLLVDLLY